MGGGGGEGEEGVMTYLGLKDVGEGREVGVGGRRVPGAELRGPQGLPENRDQQEDVVLRPVPLAQQDLRPQPGVGDRARWVTT